jgi:flagellar protein FliO/FliZ
MRKSLSSLRIPFFAILIVASLLGLGPYAQADQVAPTIQDSVPKALLVQESQIPIHLEGEKPVVNAESSLYKMMASLLVLGIFLFGGFVYIKRAGLKKTNLKANQIKVLTQHYLGPKKSLAIVRVAGESILIGVTDQNISHIKTLSLLDDDIPESTPKRFDSLVQEEDFSMKGIKDIVDQKMKTMRSIQ